MAKKKAKKAKKRAEQAAAIEDPVELLHFSIRGLLGGRVAAARGELGMRQGELAAALGKSQSWVTGIEVGRRLPPLWLLCVLGAATHKPVDTFFRAGSSDDELGAGAAAYFALDALAAAGALLEGDLEIAAKLSAPLSKGEVAGGEFNVTEERLEAGRALLRGVRAGEVDALRIAAQGYEPVLRLCFHGPGGTGPWSSAFRDLIKAAALRDGEGVERALSSAKALELLDFGDQ